jgi:parallel beta-helix repeat protein
MKRSFNLLGLALLFVVILFAVGAQTAVAQPPGSTVKWVDAAAGSDSNDGDTEATAYATLQVALANSRSGIDQNDRSYIFVKDGTYGGTTPPVQGSCNTYAAVIRVVDLDNLTIQAAPGAEPVVKPDGAAPVDIVSVSVEGSDFLIVDNLDSDQTVAQYDNWHVCNSDDLTVRNSHFEGGEDGIDFNTDLDTALIEGNSFENINTGNGDEVLDFTDGASRDVVIQDNTFTNNYRQITINGGGESRRFTIRRNLMNGTTSQEAIRLINAEDVLLENNVIYNSMQQGVYVDSGCADIEILHNTFFNNNQEGLTNGENGEIRTKITANLWIKNNIIYAAGNNPAFETPSGVTSLAGEDYNLVYNQTGSFTYALNTIVGFDPFFVSTTAGAENLRLTVASPAIETGADLGVTDDKDKNPRPAPAATLPDRGAYEFQTSPPPPTGTLTIKKLLVPADDPGLFNLQIDGVTQATDVGHNGSTGDITVDAGQHTVGETAGTNTDLGNYTSSTQCEPVNEQCAVGCGSSQAVDATNVTVGAGEEWLCTITNTRKVQNLGLTSFCTDDTAVRLWRVRNPNAFPVAYNVSGTTPTTPNPQSAPPGDSFFTTTAAAGANTTIIKWLNESGQEKQKVSASNNMLCAQITIVKDATPADDTAFPFTAPAGMGGDFTLQVPTTPQKVFSVVSFDATTTFNVTEQVPDGWQLDSIQCTGDVGDNTDTDVESATASIVIDKNVIDNTTPAFPREEISCTFRNSKPAPQAFIKLVESHAVSSVSEGQLSGEGSKACYWVTSSVPLTGDVTVNIAAQGGEVSVDKTQVILNASNYNSTVIGGGNFVCIRAVDDAVDDGGADVCKDGSADILGAPPIDAANQECGDHQDFVAHTISASTDQSVTTGTPFMSNNPANDLDQDPASVDVLVRDNDTAEVILTESFAVSDLDESGAPAGKACYWITLGSEPAAPVTVSLLDDAQVDIDKSTVVLDAANWNTINPSGDTPNRVCLTPQPENDIDTPDPHCFTGSADLLGTAGSGANVCGTHLGFVTHSLTSGDPAYGAATPFSGNGPDFDSSRRTLDALIRDDDTAGLAFQPATLNVIEGQTVTYALSLTSRPSAPVQVTTQETGQAAQGTEGKALTFTPANWNKPQTVRIQTAQDNTAEPPQTLRLAHTLSSADANYNQVAPPPLEMTIIDDDTPGVFLSTTAVSVTEGQGGASYDVVLTSQPTAQVRVELLLDSQLSASTTRLLFNRYNWNQPQRVTITAVDDAVAEDEAAARIRHSVSSSDAVYQGLAVAAIDAAVRDNDAAAVLIAASGTPVVSEDGAQTAVVNVSLASQPTANVRLSFDGGGQVSAGPGELLFTPANWNQPQRVTITAVDDAIDEKAGHNAALAAQASSADGFYDGLEPDALAVSVLDNDKAGLLFSQAAVSLRPGGAATYTITLRSQPLAAVAIDLLPDGALQAGGASCTGGESSACVVFEPGSWNTPQTVTVRGMGSSRITHHVTSQDGRYDTLTAADVRVNGGYWLYLPLTSK